MTDLRLNDVGFDYARPGGRVSPGSSRVIENLSLSLSPGEFITVIGRSGSGKTSLLGLAAGFLAPDAGEITLAGRPVTGPGAERAVVFQDDALFAWLSVRDNVAFPLKLRGVPKPERRRRADALLGQVGLSGHEGKPIWALSGGQRQRVGIARALAAEPQFLLMDEPLGALDAMTRERMQDLLLQIWRASGTGVLLITHSVEEALFVSTRVVVLAPHPGRIVLERRFDFGQRFLAGEKARALKADPEFIAAREELIAAIHEGEAEAA